MNVKGLHISSAGLSNDIGESPDRVQVYICKQWLRVFTSQLRSIRADAGSSYALKHEVERDMGPGVYVSNGAFIQAAEEEGYRWKRASDDSPNAIFNMKVNRGKYSFTVEFNNELLNKLGYEPPYIVTDDFEREAKYMMALKFYELGRLDEERAAKMAGMERTEFLAKVRK
jgi:hypothetical protein